jgi:hypothetical protein
MFVVIPLPDQVSLLESQACVKLEFGDNPAQRKTGAKPEKPATVIGHDRERIGPRFTVTVTGLDSFNQRMGEAGFRQIPLPGRCAACDKVNVAWHGAPEAVKLVRPSYWHTAGDSF